MLQNAASKWRCLMDESKIIRFKYSDLPDPVRKDFLINEYSDKMKCLNCEDGYYTSVCEECEGRPMKWIKVVDQLPLQDQHVLCTNDHHEFYTAYYTRNPVNYEPWYFEHWDSGHCCGREPKKPTHWMPLPEKPE
jgi:hypothetical protein